MKKYETVFGLTPWKIDSRTERFLGKKADRSAFWKKLYVQYYKTFDADYYKKGLRFIDKNIALFLGDLSEREKAPYVIDMVYSLHRFGCMFDEYFLYNFPLHSAKERDTFVTDKLRWSYYYRMNDLDTTEIFNDKKKCYDAFGRWFKRDLILISSQDDKAAFLDFAKKHSKFIIKPYNSSGGRGICVKDIDGMDAEACFDEMIASGDAVVCEELILQSEEMGKFHPSSVNTLRMPTIRDDEGVHLFHPLLRTGVGNAIVDNAFSGGIFALIDPETGIVCSEARDERGGSFQTHPNTGIEYCGYQIPDWEQAVALVKELALVLPECHYVGWDLAHTKDGWVMVEGNSRGQIVMMQLFYDEGFKQELEQYAAKIEKNR